MLKLKATHKKHALAAMVFPLAIAMFFGLGALSNQEQIALMRKALHIFAGHADTWLANEEQRLTPLREDPRLQGTVQDGIDGRSRQALYGFRFNQSIQDVYLYDTRAGQLMRSPETLPLPTHVLSHLRKKQPDHFVSFLVDINNAPFLVTGIPLKYPEPRPLIYALAAQPINIAISPLLKNQPSIRNYRLSLLFKHPTHKLLPHIHAKREYKLLTAPEKLYTSSPSPVSAKIKSKALPNRSLSQALSTPVWQVIISSSQSHSAPWQSLTISLLFLALALTYIYAKEHIDALFNSLNIPKLRKTPKNAYRSYNISDFTIPSVAGTGGNIYGKKNSPKEAIPTPQNILAKRRPQGHFKTWDTVQESLKLDKTVLLYQPIVDVESKTPVMYEIFLRVLDKNGNYMPPNKFLPAMEHYHAAGKLDTHVLEKLIKKHFSSGGIPEHAFTINLTGQAFDAATFMTAMMEKLPTEALTHLGFELRHHEIRKEGAAKQFMSECLDMGLPLSVNYFNGAKNMLEIAKKVGFSFVKVTKAQLDEEGFSLEQLAEHGKELGIKIILERVETEEEYEQAKACGIPYVQGYYISKPAEWEQVIK